MQELTLNELVYFNGGSEQTYENGKNTGQKVRDFIDDCGALITIISLIVVLLK